MEPPNNQKKTRQKKKPRTGFSSCTAPTTNSTKNTHDTLCPAATITSKMMAPLVAQMHKMNQGRQKLEQIAQAATHPDAHINSFIAGSTKKKKETARGGNPTNVRRTGCQKNN